MEGVVHILKRFISATIIISTFILILNFILLGVFVFKGMDEGQSPERVAQNVVANLRLKDQNYHLNQSSQQLLKQENAWAMLVDNNGQVVWNCSLPEEIPLHYTITDVAKLSRHYLMDYPVFVWEHTDGLVVIGYPKKSIAKYPLYFAADWIKSLPLRFVILFIGNIGLTLLLSILIGTRLIKSIKPLVGGIHALANEESAYVESKGVFNDLAISINHTSEMLQEKNKALKARDEARSNWIAGISHDIRTPLSMVLGYASQLEEHSLVPKKQQVQAAIIRQQAEKLRSLVNDLNLVSMLEYDMQPLHLTTVRLSALARHVASDFLNNGLHERFTISLDIANENIKVEADEKLLVRAVANLIQNSITHNPDGCDILLKTSFFPKSETCHFTVSDNGKGIPQDKLSDLLHLPYSSKRKQAITNGHGLGLPMVAKIAEAHNGQLLLESTDGNGLTAIIELPFSCSSNTIKTRPVSLDSTNLIEE